MADGFFSPEAGQRRTRWLNDKSRGVADAFRHILGPTGVMERVGLANELVNPMVGLDESREASQRLFNPSLTPAERAQAGLRMGTEIAGVVAPAAAARIAGAPLTAATASSQLADSLTGIAPSAPPVPNITGPAIPQLAGVPSRTSYAPWNRPSQSAMPRVGTDQRPRVPSGDLVDKRGFYSPTELAATNLKRESGPWAKMRQVLIDAGAKPDEIRWAGLDDRFAPDQRVSRQDVIHEMQRMGDPVNVRREGGVVGDGAGGVNRSEAWDTYNQQKQYSDEPSYLREQIENEMTEKFYDRFNALEDLEEQDAIRVFEAAMRNSAPRENQRMVWNSMTPREQQALYDNWEGGDPVREYSMIDPDRVDQYFDNMFSTPDPRQQVLPGMDGPVRELSPDGRSIYEEWFTDNEDKFFPYDLSQGVNWDGIDMDEFIQEELGRSLDDEVDVRLESQFDDMWDNDRQSLLEEIYGDHIPGTENPTGTGYYNYGGNNYFSRGPHEYFETGLVPKHFDAYTPQGRAAPYYSDIMGGPIPAAHTSDSDALGMDNIGWSRTGRYPNAEDRGMTRVIGEMQSDQQQKVRYGGLHSREATMSGLPAGPGGLDKRGRRVAPVPEQPYVTDTPATLQKRLIREELMQAMDAGDDYFAFPDAETIHNYTGGELSGHQAAYEKMAPDVLRGILKNDLGIDVPIQRVPYDTDDGVVTGTGIKLTPEILRAIREKGLPYFGIPAAGVGLGSMMGEEYEKSAM